MPSTISRTTAKNTGTFITRTKRDMDWNQFMKARGFREMTSEEIRRNRQRFECAKKSFGIMKKKTAVAPPITSPRIKHLAGKGLRAPSTLTTKQVRELAGSVERHIKRKGK